jgi:hypothetical protein
VVKARQYTMPERQPNDGAIGVRREDGYVVLTVDGKSLRMSDFNAWRIFGAMSLLYHFTLPRALQKAICFVTPGKVLPSGAAVQFWVKL